MFAGAVTLKQICVQSLLPVSTVGASTVAGMYTWSAVQKLTDSRASPLSLAVLRYAHTW